VAREQRKTEKSRANDYERTEVAEVKGREGTSGIPSIHFIRPLCGTSRATVCVTFEQWQNEAPEDEDLVPLKRGPSLGDVIPIDHPAKRYALVLSLPPFIVMTYQ
jgi:hypothetical protein